MFLFSSGTYPELELLNHLVVLFLIVWGTLTLFSIVAAPIYVPSSTQWVPFLNILSNTFYFLSSWWQLFWYVWGNILLCFLFLFPWWLMILNIVSCTCWPSECLLWEISIWMFWIFFNHFFLLNCRSYLCILDGNYLSDIQYANNFSPWGGYFFISLM